MALEYKAVWAGAHADNFTTGRYGFNVQAVVIHIAEGSYEGTISWFNQGLAARQAAFNRQAKPGQRPIKANASSTQFVASRGGKCAQCVRFGDTAYHAGWNKGIWRLRRSWVNPNWVTVGIENEGRTGDGLTEEQYEINSWIIAVTAARFKFKINLDTVVPHAAMDQVNRRNCPGANVDFRRLVAQANTKLERLPE